MSIKQSWQKLLASMPAERLRQVLDFARFLRFQGEREQWQAFDARQLARAYGPDEPDYSQADLTQA